MPQFTILKTKLETDFSRFANTEKIAADNIAGAFEAYCKTIINVASGTFISMAGVEILKVKLENIFRSQSQVKTQIGSDVATAIDECYKTLLTTHQTQPPTPILGTLLTEMQTIFSKQPNSGTEFGSSLAQAIHKSVSQSIISGVFPSAPPAPFAGPPS